MQNLLGLRPEEILLSKDVDFANKGGLAEMFVGLELVKYHPAAFHPECYYWQRNGNEGQAEVDYITVRNGKIVPIEVKAGVRGSMQSLYYFMQKKNCEYGIRTSLEPFGAMERVKIIPLYAVRQIL